MGHQFHLRRGQEVQGIRDALDTVADASLVNHITELDISAYNDPGSCAGVENALRQADYLAGENLSIADISFVCDFAQFLREGHYEEALAGAGLALISHDGPRDYPHAYSHMLRLAETEAFAKHLGTYLDWYRRK